MNGLKPHVVAASIAFATCAVSPGAIGADTISACVNDKNGAAKFVAPGTKCGKNETLQTWNIAGPRGATGAMGATGTVGAQGATGALGPAGPSFLAGRTIGVPEDISFGPVMGIGNAAASGAAVYLLSPSFQTTATRITAIPTGTAASGVAQLVINGVNTNLACAMTPRSGGCSETEPVLIPANSFLAIRFTTISSPGDMYTTIELD